MRIRSNLIIILTSAFILHAHTGKAQADCTFAKIGTFELNSPTSGRTIIIRTDSTQRELNESFRYEAIFNIIWTDSCTYELREKKLIKGDIRFAGQPGDVLKVEILKIEGNKVFVRSSSNYSELVLERILVKLE